MVTNWTSLGNPPNVQWGSRPSVARNSDGRLEVLVLDSSGALWHIQQTSPGMNWTSWTSLGIAPNTNVLPDLVVEGNADGRLEVFGHDSAGALWHSWQTSPGDGWSNWFSLGSPPGGASKSSLAVTHNADGRLEVFTLGNDGAVWHLWQVAPNTSWSGWASLAHPPTGAIAGGPFVGTNADGRLEVFALDSQGALWHIWQTSAGGVWFHWFSSGHPQGNTLVWLDVIRNADGRLEVFARSEGLWHIWQTAPNGTWSPWASFGEGGPEGLGGRYLGAHHAAKNADGRLEVFLTAAPPAGDTVLFHIWQVTPGGDWGDWTYFDTPTSPFIANDVSVAENVDGRLEVFNSIEALWRAEQVTPGVWG